MIYTQHTQPWGNATGIRLPQKALQAARWQTGQTVSINVRGNSITLIPIKTPRLAVVKQPLPRLQDLLKGVTRDQFTSSELDWGPDVGAEIIDDDYSR
jgi:antitoxin MazE